MKSTKKIVAQVLCGLLITQTSIFAIAEEPPVTETVEVSGETQEINADISTSDGSGVIANSSANVTVNGDVTAETGYGVLARDNTTVNIDGNVTGYSNGVKAENNSEINVSGDIFGIINGEIGIDTGAGAAAWNDSNISVDGNVSGTLTGVFARESSTIDIGGNVVSTGVHSVHNGENVSSGRAIFTDGTSDIRIKGDASGLTDGIVIALDTSEGSDTRQGLIVVDGTLSVANANSNCIDLYVAVSDTDDEDVDIDDNGFATINPGYNPCLPTIILYGIEGKGTFINNRTDIDDSKLINNINYIVRKGESDSEANLSYSGYTVKNGYDTAIEGTEIKISVAEGYEAVSTGKAKITKNEDGTFTLVVPRGGNVTISALKAAIKKAESTGSATVRINTEDENDNADSGSSEPSITISDYSSYAHNPPAGSVAYAVLPNNTAYINIKTDQLAPLQYETAVTDLLYKIVPNGTLRLETNRSSYIDTVMVNAFSKRPDVDIEIIYMKNGKKYKIIIPKYYPVSTLLNTYGYCDFDRLGTIFGAFEVQ